MSLPALCVKRPVAVLMAAITVAVIGVIGFCRLPVDLMPNYNMGDISIFVNIRGGMPPQEIESMVAKPIEDAVSDVGHLRDVISICEEGRARVALRFQGGANLDYAVIEVREKIAAIRDKLPREAERPVIAKFEQSDAPVIILAFAGSGQTTERLRKIVDTQIKDRILRISGVANVEIGGGRERKIMIDVDEKALSAYKVPMSVLVRALGAGNLNLLVGEKEAQDKRYLLRVTGEFDSIEAIGELPLLRKDDSSVVRLKDVAKVSDSYLEASSYARVNNSQVVSLYIQKETNANTIKVCEALAAEFENIKKDLHFSDQGLKFIVTYNQSEAIKRAIDSVRNSLIFGAILATMVLFFFLRDIRSILVIFTTIPFSLAVAFMLMYLFPGQIGLNIMTLSGLALGVGMLLDNSVVVLENILKLKNEKVERFKAIVGGTNEMSLAIVASTLTSIVVFLPITFVNPEIRIIYSGFALTVVFSLLASLLVAVTIVPVAYDVLTRHEKLVDNPYAGFRVMRAKYRKFLGLILRFRFEAIVGVGLLFIVSLLVFNRFIPKEFIGAVQEDDFTIFIELPTGAKLDISNNAVAELENILHENKDVKTFSSRIESWSSKIYVKLRSPNDRSHSSLQVIDALRPVVKNVEKKYKEAFIYFEQPQSVETNEILVEIYGYDYSTLSSLAVKMISAAEKVKGLSDLKIRWRKGRPEWKVVVDRQKAALYGLTVEDVAQTLHSQMRGLRATLYHTQGREVEVVSRFQEESRNTLSKLKRMPIELQRGGTIYLEQVADFIPDIAAGKIWRKNKNRMIQISADRGSLAFGTAVDKLENAFKSVDFPKDYHYKFGDNYFRMVENQRQLGFAILLMVILVFLVLAALFESYIKPFIIMMSVPMAVIGSVLFLLIFHKAVNIGVLMGFIILGGIVVNNAIVMLDHISLLRAKGYKLNHAVVKGATDRLRPVLITSLTTILGMLPLIFDMSEDAAMWSPLAVTVAGGMLSSTILTLFIIPAIYLLLDDVRAMFSK
jgi:HAE1 family hydrophobic/amphiphilic exporter-1